MSGSGVVLRVRVAQLARLPKSELVRRCEAAGEMGGIHPLRRWSKHELATVAARAEQRLAVA